MRRVHLRAHATERLARSRDLHSSVLQAARVEFGLPSTVGRADQERRDVLGVASFDAYALARATGATLHADDLGLRALAHAEQRVPSFSTAAYRVLDGGLTGDRVLDCLGGPRVPEQSAAVAGANAQHALITSTILTVPLERVSRRLAQALIAHRAPRDMIPIYEWALEQRFKWFPRELAQIRRVTWDTIRECMTLGE